MLLKRRKKYDIKSLLNKINNENVYKNFFLFIMGLAIGSIAVSLIYNRYNIVTSGSTGIAILLNKIFQIDLSVMVLVVCSILLVIGFAVFGGWSVHLGRLPKPGLYAPHGVFWCRGGTDFPDLRECRYVYRCFAGYRSDIAADQLRW